MLIEMGGVAVYDVMCMYYSVRRILCQRLADQTNLLYETSRLDNFPGRFLKVRSASRVAATQNTMFAAATVVTC